MFRYRVGQLREDISARHWIYELTTGVQLPAWTRMSATCWNDTCVSPDHVSPTTAQRLKREIIRKAKSRPCSDCGISYPFYVMDFDHRDSAEKLFNLSDASSRSLDAIRGEIAKCDVVCANCHRERTQVRLDFLTPRGE